MDAADRELLQATVRDALTAHADASPADDDSGRAPADAVLAELGWLEMLEAEPRDAVAIVAHALGATDTYASVLDDVFAAALGVEPRPGLAVVLPSYPGTASPAHAAGGAGAGIGTARAATADELLVVRPAHGAADAIEGVIVPASAAEVTSVRGIAPRWGATKVAIPTVSGTDVDLAPGAWDDAIAAGRRAVGHEIVGANRTMIAMAREHALDRTQFGKPIAQFQALRHKLAEALVAVEAADAALVAAWDERDSTSNLMTAALAKALAARGARVVAANTQQVLAGIGFTTDHAFHHFLKRCLLLEGMFGSAESITLEVGRHLLATRTVPTLIEL
jgi:hypothetical protein